MPRRTDTEGETRAPDRRGAGVGRCPAGQGQQGDPDLRRAQRLGRPVPRQRREPGRASPGTAAGNKDRGSARQGGRRTKGKSSTGASPREHRRRARRLQHRGQGRSQGPSRAGPEQGSAARIPSAPPGASQGQEPRRAAAGEQSPARRARGDLPDARQVWKPKWPVPRRGGIAGKSGKRGSNHRPQAEGGRSQGGGHRGGPWTPWARKGPRAPCPAGPPQTGTPARDRALQPGYLVPRQARHGDRAPPRGEGRPEPRQAGLGGPPKSPPGAENTGDRSPAGRA